MQQHRGSKLRHDYHCASTAKVSIVYEPPKYQALPAKSSTHTKSIMPNYSLIPPEYKSNANNMSTTALPVTPPRPRTQQTYNDTTQNRALGYSALPSSKSMSSFPTYSPSPWELEVAMAVSKAAKPKRKALPLILTMSPSAWEYEVAMAASTVKPKRKPKPLSPWEYQGAVMVSERTPTPRPMPKPSPKPSHKPLPKPLPKKKPYTSKFTELGVDDFSEPYKADYRAKIDPEFRFESEREQERKKGGKMAQVVKDLCKGFHHGTGGKK
jgi:hypothetical protein